MALSSLEDNRLKSFELSEKEFARVIRMVYDRVGIHLKDGKQDLVKARLSKRVKALGLESYNAYLDFVESDKTGQELAELIDQITTNKTQFFRDAEHFQFMRAQLFPRLNRESRRVRFWCAGCSYGQEPYTLSMALREAVQDIDAMDLRILATDICRPALEGAQQGAYDETEVEGISPELLSKYFVRTKDGNFEAKQSLKKLITFARLNLMEKWPMKGPFQAILCRNVMIYFDRPTRENLISRFWELLVPGGYFFVGGSESLTGLTQPFKYVRPAVYVKQ